MAMAGVEAITCSKEERGMAKTRVSTTASVVAGYADSKKNPVWGNILPGPRKFTICSCPSASVLKALTSPSWMI
ncbi:hypothetical protein D3C76_1834700 [compost metagenome]